MIFFRIYILNFFKWWYYYLVPDVYSKFTVRFIFILNRTNTLVMIRNISQPLFHDFSLSGRLIGFVFRFIWIWFGGIISILAILPRFIFMILVVFWPALTLVVFSLAILGL